VSQQLANSDDATASAAPKMGWPRTLARLVEGRNINPETLLATDYLNHFNEVVMLIEMSSDMPDCIEDVAEWQPLSYEDHFRRSTFADKDLAILAYENAPARHREPFDAIVDQANRLATAAAAELTRVYSSGEAYDPAILSDMANRYTANLRRLVDMASGIINGHGLRMDQSEIDAILAE